MKTMLNLCKRFERLNPGYAAILDNMESYPGCYRVYITANDIGSWYTFTTCKDFQDWCNGVVLD